MEAIARSASPAEEMTEFHVQGDVHADQVLSEIIAFLTEAPTPLVLWDFRRGSLRKLSSSDLRMIVDRGAPYTVSRAGGRTAIVCADDIDFGLSRMFKTFAELHAIPFEIRVFRDLEKALSWLNAAA